MCGLEALPLGGRELQQGGSDFLAPRVFDPDRHEIGIGEVTVIRRLFLASLADGDASLGVPAACLLWYVAQLVAGRCPLVELSAGLVLDRLLDAAKTVEIFNFDDRR